MYLGNLVFPCFWLHLTLMSFEHPEMPFIAPPPFVCSAVATVIFLDYFLHDVFSELWFYWGVVFVNLLCCCDSSNVCEILLNARSVARMLIPCMTLWIGNLSVSVRQEMMWFSDSKHGDSIIFCPVNSQRHQSTRQGTLPSLPISVQCLLLVLVRDGRAEFVCCPRLWLHVTGFPAASKLQIADYCLMVLCQDSGIALKIFELALKRYGMQAECVWEYINYMSRLNGKMLCWYQKLASVVNLPIVCIVSSMHIQSMLIKCLYLILSCGSGIFF